MEVITINNKKMSEFTLIDVIERQVHFTKTNTIFDKIDFKDYDEGKLLAFSEMLEDVNTLKEDEFVDKYQNIMKKLAKKFEDNEAVEDEREKITGYNNAVVTIMMCINPHFEYELKE
ncbi:hypothetical protein [Planococcus shenhongbingii]|uniref:Uncharacterized protein n=1 Tax=Planococcus shenhongbingii TaxID=3058398 RepID=A0ABT8N7M2_9BACL|nr:hypothetical protein [Planococcus sp. N017]MDN7243880.1 hypothetical protein [Planococcus sp. N017]